MSLLSRPNRVVLAAGTIGLALVASACASTETKPSAGGVSASAAPECAAFTQYGNHAGKTVSIYAPIRDAEADLFEQAWKPFATCTGMKITYEGTGEFEAQIQVRVDGGSPPDIAFFPQPGLVERFAKAGKLKPASAEVKKLTDEGWSADWAKYSTVDGSLLRRPAGRQREVLRLVLAGHVQGEGLGRPQDVGRADDAHQHDRRHRHQAVVRGHRVR